jgi:hypothetical protein
MYVLKRTDQGGGYVAKPGRNSSYTMVVRNMQKFNTVEEANNNRCPDNEVAVPIEYLLN